MPQFPFVQFEYTHSIGPPAGRYTVAPIDANGSGPFGASEVRYDIGEGEVSDPDVVPGMLGTADVLVIQVRGAPGPAPRRFRPGMPSVPAGEQPAEVSVTIVTVVMATHMVERPAEAKRLLENLTRSPEEQQRFVESALNIVRRGVVAYRLAAADPYVPDLSPLDSRAVRIGYGEAAEVVRGRWTEALGVKPPPAPKVNRTVRLMPVQAMAAMLNGAAGGLEAEEMILAAIRDIDHGRFRAAAVTLDAAQELLLSELAGETLASRVAPLLSKLEESRPQTREIAERALIDQLSTRDFDRLRTLIEDAGALIDAWRYVPLGFG